jgi:anti-sigma B factor antagonist
MKIQHQANTLHISELEELIAANSNAFREETRAALPAGLKAIDVDLSQTSALDSHGLGALLNLQKTAGGPNRNEPVAMRLLDPTPPVQQIFDLTRMSQIFEIVQTKAANESRRPGPTRLAQ